MKNQKSVNEYNSIPYSAVLRSLFGHVESHARCQGVSVIITEPLEIGILDYLKHIFNSVTSQNILHLLFDSIRRHPLRGFYSYFSD